MIDRTVWWVCAGLDVANFGVGIWDITTGLAWGAIVCFAVGVVLAVCLVRYSSDLLRRQP